MACLLNPETVPTIDKVLVPTASQIPPSVVLLKEQEEEEIEDFSFFQISEELAPSQPKHSSLSGIQSLSLDELDQLLIDVSNVSLGVQNEEQKIVLEKLKIYEDGGAIGCGGVLWVAGKLLALYLFKKWEKISNESKILSHGQPITNILELGAGTGITAIALGKFLSILNYNKGDYQINTTDIGSLIPIMNRNIEGNGLDSHVKAYELFWGVEQEDIPVEVISKEGVDLILAADCVYNERAFDILIKTLVDISQLTWRASDGNRFTTVLLASKIRRKADKRFFKKLFKFFESTELNDFDEFEFFKRQSVFVLKLNLKKKFLV